MQDRGLYSSGNSICNTIEASALTSQLGRIRSFSQKAFFKFFEKNSNSFVGSDDSETIGENVFCSAGAWASTLILANHVQR
jgi:hypothetical protein